jgi:hypothetical protein
MIMTPFTAQSGLQLDFFRHYFFAEFGVKSILQILFQFCKFYFEKFVIQNLRQYIIVLGGT